MVFLQSGIDKAFSEKEARAGVGAPLPSRPRAQAPRASDALVQCEADIAAMRAASAAAQLLPRLSEDQRRAEARLAACRVAERNADSAAQFHMKAKRALFPSLSDSVLWSPPF